MPNLAPLLVLFVFKSLEGNTLPYKIVEEDGRWCIHKMDDDGSIGDVVKCHKTMDDAKEQMGALMAAMDKEGKMAAMKMWDDEYIYVPYGVTTFADALADQNLREQVSEIKKQVSMFQSLAYNILGNFEVTDKKAALSSLSTEFQGMISPDIDSLGSDMGADENKAKRAGSPKASDYLVVEDAKDPSKWHLPVKENGKPNHRLMGGAWAALHSGYRGSKYSGPGKDSAIAKLKRLYKAEGLPLPGEKSIFIDDEDMLVVKSVGPNRVGTYCALWGDETRKDLTGEWFDPDTEEMTNIFDSVGKLPYFYNHTLNEELKSTVIGVVDKLVKDHVGLWYEAELKLANEYEEYVKKLLKDGKLKTSTQTFPVARRVAKSGRIERWPIVEISATPSPAEPRMLPVGTLKSAFTEIGCDEFSCVMKEFGILDDSGDNQGIEKVRLQTMLEQERELLLNL